MQEIVDAILEQAETPPVILIQGDHGPGSLLNFGDINGTCLRERVPILSAYYLPSSGIEQLYASISPVNSFRVVFNSVFGAGLHLLPDRSYYSTWSNPYTFADVTNDTDQSCESLESAGAIPSR